MPSAGQAQQPTGRQLPGWRCSRHPGHLFDGPRAWAVTADETHEADRPSEAITDKGAVGFIPGNLSRERHCSLDNQIQAGAA